MRPASRSQAPSSRIAGRGQGATAQNRALITTPEPQWPETLSLKKGDIVRLLRTGDALLPEFPAGELVIIKDYRSSRSPSHPAPEGQTPNDSDSIYGFKKKVSDQHITWHISPNVGMLGAPKHEDLSLSPSLKTLSERKYKAGEKVYLRSSIKIHYINPISGQTSYLYAPVGTRCFVAQKTTSTDPRSVALKHRSVYSVENSWYIIQVKVSTPYWREVMSPVRMDVANFEKSANSNFSDKNLLHQGIPTVISISETDIYKPDDHSRQ